MPKIIKKIADTVRARVGREIIGRGEVVDLALITLLNGGHMLLEDVPGTGKTLLAKTFAASLSLDFKRVQCVPDLLPSDLIGINFFDMKLSEFRFVKGPVFTNILLADEINRAMPKTQAGLLECMEERQVTVDGVTYPLEGPFMVIATQNPVESRGTFELPEAQLDRFLVKASMGYPTWEESITMVERKLRRPAEPEISAVSRAEIAAAAEELNRIYVHRDIIAYAASICSETRSRGGVVLGASPRALIHLVKVSAGFAALEGREYVLPDDVKRAARPVLAHRIVFANSFFETRGQGENLIAQILETVPVPSEQIDFTR
ncbi:MAG: MoxR family ATPase [Clostridiales bacterium]|jgi:MoxR-like ATPase|nr:MoxR family ATPase [Clostridiales bacterium]HOA84813.1 MoxR family ATPase [Bacillota bacterium]